MFGFFRDYVRECWFMILYRNETLILFNLAELKSN